jgi:hypothetical protein
MPGRPFKRTLKRKEGRDVVYQRFRYSSKLVLVYSILQEAKVSGELHRLKRNRSRFISAVYVPYVKS